MTNSLVVCCLSLIAVSAMIDSPRSAAKDCLLARSIGCQIPIFSLLPPGPDSSRDSGSVEWWLLLQKLSKLWSLSRWSSHLSSSSIPFRTVARYQRQLLTRSILGLIVEHLERSFIGRERICETESCLRRDRCCGCWWVPVVHNLSHATQAVNLIAS